MKSLFRHPKLFSDLLNLYSKGEGDTLFTLLCLKIYIEDPITSTIWNSLTQVQRLLLLDIFAWYCDEQKIPAETVNLLIALYKVVFEL